MWSEEGKRIDQRTGSEKVWGQRNVILFWVVLKTSLRGGNIYGHKMEPDSAGENLQLDVAGSESWGSQSFSLAFSLL